MEVATKLEDVLGECFGDDRGYDLELDVSEYGSVTAILTTARFESQTELERQNLIWDCLDAQLDDEEAADVNIVIANTPEETAAMEDDEDGAKTDELEAELERIFRSAFGSGTTLELRDIGDQRLSGSLLSRSFAGKSEDERQKMIWDVIDEKLPPSRRRHVVSIRPKTPDEAAESRG